MVRDLASNAANREAAPSGCFAPRRSGSFELRESVELLAPIDIMDPTKDGDIERDPSLEDQGLDHGGLVGSGPRGNQTDIDGSEDGDSGINGGSPEGDGDAAPDGDNLATGLVGDSAGSASDTTAQRRQGVSTSPCLEHTPSKARSE